MSQSTSTDKQSLFGLPKLPRRYATVVMPLFLSIIMTCLVSFISTFRGLAPGQDFLTIWLESWLASWIIGFPILLLVLPLVRKLTALVVKSE